MKLIITGRHLDVTEAMKAYVEEKLSRLERYANDIIDIHVLLGMERHNAVAEVNMKLKRFHINVKEKEKEKDMYAAIDKAFDVVKKQLIRHEEQLKSHRVKRTEV
jgi:putative sigma-54 modulation protein